LEALETAVRREALRLAGKVVERWLNTDTSDYAGSHLPCACGQDARYAGRRSKRVQSVLGPLELERAYYHCRDCGQGFYPRDQQWGVDHSSLSPAVTRMAGTVGALVSFEEGSQLLAELAGVEVETKQVERTAEALGAEIAADEKQDFVAVEEPSLPETFYLGIDGTGVPMRRSEEGSADNSPTAHLRLAKLNSAPSGAPSLGMPRDDLCEIRDLSPILRQSKVPGCAIPMMFSRSLPSESYARRRVAALPKLAGRSS
jgi:hypothetical protein